VKHVSDKKSLIIEVAEILFQRFGYSKTSLDDIAREASLGKGTIYYYFESKEEIFYEVVLKNAENFYKILNEKLAAENDFIAKFTMAISLPFKLSYEHAPLLIDALQNLPEHYLQKMNEFKITNKKKMLKVLNDIMKEGLQQKVITESVPIDKLVNIIFDWFLMGDSNITIKNFDAFIKKIESDYEMIVQLMLYGILKRGKTL